jgi:hypothetical protein
MKQGARISVGGTFPGGNKGLKREKRKKSSKNVKSNYCYSNNLR